MRSLPLLLLIGCAPVTRIGDKIVGLTNPVLVGGLVLGTRPPSDPNLRAALALNGIDRFTEVRLVVADALELQDVDNALVTDASLTLTSDDDHPMELGEDGWYRLDPDAAPDYRPGDTWTLTAEMTDRVLPGTVTVPLPEAANVAFDAEYTPGEDIVFDLTGQGFDYAFAAVYDLEGEEVFSTAPATNDEIVDLVLPISDPVERVTVPGDVLDDGIYIVGLAGMVRAPAENVEGLNEALTAVLAGRLELFPVVSGSRLAASALFLGAEQPEPAVAAQLAAAGVEIDGAVEVFVADLLTAGTPVEGGTLTVNGLPVPDLGGGRYRLEGFDYVPGAVADLSVIAPLAAPGTLAPTLPDAVAAEVPATSFLGQGLTLGLPGEPHEIGLAFVVGASGLTWSNIPETPEAWQYVLSQDGAVTSIRVPATAFPTPGAYAIGVAAIDTFPEAVEDLNPTYSEAMAGRMSFHNVLISP